MEYWRKNLSYKTKVFFFTYPPGCRWHCHGEAMWKSCEMREKCEILDGRELVHMHTSIQGQKDGRFFFLFLLLCPRNTTLPVSFRIKYWATMQPCMHECDLPGCALDDHWLREMKKDSCAFPVVKTWLLAYPHMRFCGRLLRTWLQTHQLTPLLLDGRWCKWRRVFW